MGILIVVWVLSLILRKMKELSTKQEVEAKSAYPPTVAGTVEQISTSHNKRFSEMAVDVEAWILLHPVTFCDSSSLRLAS